MLDVPYPEDFLKIRSAMLSQYCWRYENQEPCLKCLAKPMGPNGPLYYEKETYDGKS